MRFCQNINSVERRLAVNLHLNPNVKTIMSGHGNIRSYLHRLKFIGSQSVHANKTYEQQNI